MNENFVAINKTVLLDNFCAGKSINTFIVCRELGDDVLLTLFIFQIWSRIYSV